MLHFLGEFDQFPGGGENSFVSLLLPERDVELATGILAHGQFRSPCGRQ
jgi:hypothetical protein